MDLPCRVPVASGHPFPLQNLPYGAFVRAGETTARLGVALGDFVVDLHHLAEAGLFDGVPGSARAALRSSRLNSLLALGPRTWSAVRERLSAFVSTGTEPGDGALLEGALVPVRDVRLELPVDVADYVDFYSSRHHAENVGALFRPRGGALAPNWRWLPVGYHGRASGVCVGGTPVVRPAGQRAPDEPGGVPHFGPCRQLDFELELGFITGDGPPLGTPLDIGRAAETIFGVVLLDDWSARDLQLWENQPLGPFLSKAFATSISPWVVPLAALRPFAVEPPDRPAQTLAHLRGEARAGYDIELEVELVTREGARAVVTRSNAKHLYWSMPQQLAHLGSSGARVRAGDLFGTGTISGPTPESMGCLLELSARGTRPLAIAPGIERTFLEDGDEVVMRGTCRREGFVPIGFGDVRGIVVPAHSNESDIVPASVNPSSR